MTANDRGHINNLDKTQVDALKSCWISLIDRMCRESSLSDNQIIGSPQGDELFRAIGYDDPDVLILRWLRARKFDVEAAVEQLINTLKWRRTFGVDTLIANGEKELIVDELRTEKTYFMGQDRENRPIIYIHVKEHIKDQYPVLATQKLAILAIETGRKLLKNPVETVTVVVDMSGFGMHNMDYQLVRFFIDLMENHYPESLGLALVLHAPLIFHSCWTIIRHWLDPVVESKIHFLRHNDDLTKYIDLSNLPQRLNGTHSNYQYIPADEQEKIILTELHSDKQGRKLARANHRKVARVYLDLTMKWARGDEKVIEERKQAAEQLRDAFERFVPFFHTRTCYHRIGAIDEPIFDLTYEKTRRNKELKIVEF